MPEQQVNPEQRMRLPVRLKVEKSPGEPRTEQPKTTDDMFNEVMETLKKNMQLEGAARASRVYSASAEGEKGDRGEGPSAVRPFQDLMEAGKVFGINFGELMAQKSAELEALRGTVDVKDKEVHEMRLRELTQMEERIKNAAAEIAKVREGDGDRGKGGLGSLLGLGGLDPDVKKRVEERVFGLTEPPTKDREDSKQPAPFTKEWFEGWGEMKPGIEAFVRMLGYVPREENHPNRGDSQALVSREDIASGKIPTELALGLRRLELENEREKIRNEHEHEERMERNKIFSGIRETIDRNAPDAIAALRDMAGEHNRAAEIEGPGGSEALERPKGIRCSECSYEFLVSQELEKYTCPSCGTTLEVPIGQPEVAVEE